MPKIVVSNICAVGFIYRKAKPTEIFMEVKDNKHPQEFIRGQLSPLGGNWFGEAARGDVNTISTFRREIEEELSFDRPVRDSSELSLMGFSRLYHFDPSPLDQVATLDDVTNLNLIKKSIRDSTVPFGDFLNVLKFPESTSIKHFQYLASYFAVPLEEDIWEILVRLQRKFRNLSSESLTLLTSLREIIETGTKTTYAHDRVLQLFFQKIGLDARNLPIVPGGECIPMGLPMDSYTNYLACYEVGKRPF